jgi:hypothetical protein
MFAAEIAQDLQREYAHTLLFDSPLVQIQHPALLYAQSVGMHVLHVDRITQQTLAEPNGFTGAILYNVEGHSHIGSVLPSIYYSHGIYDPRVDADVVVPSSAFAAKTGRKGEKLKLDTDLIIPPFFQTRSVRRIKGPKRPFTVGIVTSGYADKYPSDLVIHLMQHIPDDIGVLVSTMPEYKHPGTSLAIDERHARTGKGLMKLPIITSMGIRYMIGADAIIHASSPTHNDPASRLVIEAMALGKAVIAERRGGCLDYLEHGVNSLLFSTPAEALDHILRIQRDEPARNMLGANAQMWASWQDASVHIGKLKRILRMIGA